MALLVQGMQKCGWAKDQGINTSRNIFKIEVLKILEDKQEDQDIKEKKLGQIGGEETLRRSIEKKR